MKKALIFSLQLVFRPPFKLCGPSAVNVVLQLFLHSSLMFCSDGSRARVVHAANMRPERLLQLLQLCLGGRQSCKPTGASVAAAKLLLEHQKVAQGMD